MSQETVEIVEGCLRAWNRGDRDGWLAPTHPEVEWSSAIQRQVEGADRVYRGQAEVGRFWDEWHALWNTEIDFSEVRDLGDTVLALAEFRAKGKGSGAEVEQSIGYLFEFEDGLIRRAKAYLSPEKALEAAGLSE
jgi:ketosteroid isomerase-like protein